MTAEVGNKTRGMPHRAEEAKARSELANEAEMPEAAGVATGGFRKLPVRRSRDRPEPNRWSVRETRGAGARLPVGGLAWGSFFPGFKNCFSLFRSRSRRLRCISIWRRGDGPWAAAGAPPPCAAGAAGCPTAGVPDGKEKL